MTITLRYRSKLGTGRIELNLKDDLAILSAAIGRHIKNVDVSSIEIADRPNGPHTLLSDLYGRSIGDMGMKHGDMIFIRYSDVSVSKDEAVRNDQAVEHNNAGRSGSVANADAWKTVKQHPVDDALEAISGEIHRPRSRMCKHANNAMCEYCMPLQPYDASYLAECKIKHSSFHAYLRKLNAKTNKPESGSSFIPPLTEHSFEVKRDCITGHLPWPAGICSRCQPSAITLQRQEYRMVDHVEFASSMIVESFLDYWRHTGYQRFGYLYGHYEIYETVPLGQKAVVEAIYEPPQLDDADGLELMTWEDEAVVDNLAKRCGLQRVGLIFTDLTDDGTGTGSVIVKRHNDSFFLSGLEASLAASHQTLYPNASHWSVNGRFGSKFLSIVVSGNLEGQIDLFPYQISEQGTAMFKAGIIEASVNPNMILVSEESKDLYVPDVFYSTVNEYGRQVKQVAKPAFPMEYLLVTLTYGIPKEVLPRFARHTFPIEHRESSEEINKLRALSEQLQIDSESHIDAISDFHMLLYILALGIFSVEDTGSLVNAAVNRDIESVQRLVSSVSWQTLLLILSESSGMLQSRKRIADG